MHEKTRHASQRPIVPTSHRPIKVVPHKKKGRVDFYYILYIYIIYSNHIIPMFSSLPTCLMGRWDDGTRDVLRKSHRVYLCRSGKAVQPLRRAWRRRGMWCLHFLRVLGRFINSFLRATACCFWRAGENVVTLQRQTRGSMDCRRGRGAAREGHSPCTPSTARRASPGIADGRCLCRNGCLPAL